METSPRRLESEFLEEMAQGGAGDAQGLGRAREVASMGRQGLLDGMHFGSLPGDPQGLDDFLVPGSGHALSIQLNLKNVLQTRASGAYGVVFASEKAVARNPRVLAIDATRPLHRSFGRIAPWSAALLLGDHRTTRFGRFFRPWPP